MKVSAVLAFAIGATASFTKATRNNMETPAASVDLFREDDCTSLNAKDRDTIDGVINFDCTQLDAVYDSFYIRVNEKHIDEDCTVLFYNEPTCDDGKGFEPSRPSYGCITNPFDKDEVRSMRVVCQNVTTAPDS